VTFAFTQGGERGGPCINSFLKEGISPRDAAKKLAEMFHIGQEKAPAHTEKGPVTHIEKPSVNNLLDDSSSASGVKYMKDVEVWFDSLIRRGDQEDDAQYRKRLLNAIKSRLIESYRNGKKSLAAWLT